MKGALDMFHVAHVPLQNSSRLENVPQNLRKFRTQGNKWACPLLFPASDSLLAGCFDMPDSRKPKRLDGRDEMRREVKIHSGDVF